MICIFARGRGVVVEKARMEEATRGSERSDCILLSWISSVAVKCANDLLGVRPFTRPRR